MKTGRGRWIALLIVAVVVPAAFGFFIRRRVVEAWYVARLDAEDVDARCAAIRWLGQNGSESGFVALVGRELEFCPDLLILRFGRPDQERHEFLDSADLPRMREFFAINHAMDVLQERFGIAGYWHLAARLIRWNQASARAKVHGAQFVFLDLDRLQRRLTESGQEVPGDPAAVRREVAEAKKVQRLIPSADRELALKILATSLASKDAWVRAGAACGLRAAGEAASHLLPALQTALRDENSMVREAARDAVEALKIPDNVDSR